MRASQSRETGAVLLMVLVALALLAAVAASSARLAASAIVSTKAEGALLGEQITVVSALALIAARMNGPNPLPQDGTPVALKLPDREIEVRVHAVAGLVNPNSAPRPLLVALFRTAGTQPLLAEQLADRIITKRTLAEAQGAGRAFRFASDMRRLLADQAGLWVQLRGLTTFMGANVNFDPNTAPLRLRAVAPPATLGGFDLYAGTAALESAGLYEVYISNLDPALGGVTHASVSITASGYRVVALDWPQTPLLADRNPVP